MGLCLGVRGFWVVVSEDFEDEDEDMKMERWRGGEERGGEI